MKMGKGRVELLEMERRCDLSPRERNESEREVDS